MSAAEAFEIRIRNMEQSAESLINILRELRREAQAAAREIQQLQAKIQELDREIEFAKSGKSRHGFSIGIGLGG